MFVVVVSTAAAAAVWWEEAEGAHTDIPEDRVHLEQRCAFGSWALQSLQGTELSINWLTQMCSQLKCLHAEFSVFKKNYLQQLW